MLDLVDIFNIDQVKVHIKHRSKLNNNEDQRMFARSI